MQQPKPLVVITQAHSLIGLACARIFHQASHPLLLLDNDQQKLDTLLAEFALNNIFSQAVDLSDMKALGIVVKDAMKLYGKPACFLHLSFSPGEAHPEDQRVKQYLLAAMSSLELSIQTLRARPKGVIMQVSIVDMAQNPASSIFHYPTPQAMLSSVVQGMRAEAIAQKISMAMLSLHIHRPGLNFALPQSLDKEEQACFMAEKIAHSIYFTYQQAQCFSMQDLCIELE